MATQLCTLAQVNARLGESAAANTTILTPIIDAYSVVIANTIGRYDKATGTNLMLRQSGRTEYHTGRLGELLPLEVFPVETITSVTLAPDRDFDSGTTLDADDDYRLDSRWGILLREGTTWSTRVNAIRVVYTGGYVAPGDQVGEGQIALPLDLVEAAVQQVIFQFKTRQTPGVRTSELAEGATTFYDWRPLLPGVRDIIEDYRRRIG